MKTNNLIIKITNILLGLVAVILSLLNFIFYDGENYIGIIIALVSIILYYIRRKFDDSTNLVTRVVFDVLLIISYTILLFIMLVTVINKAENMITINYVDTFAELSYIFIFYILFKMLVVSIIRLFKKENMSKLCLTTASFMLINIVQLIMLVAIKDIYMANLQFDNGIYLVMFLFIGLISIYDFKIKPKKKM